MKISIDEQTKRFYLATTEWIPLVGHEIKVGKYKFSAVASSDKIIVSEVTSGTKVFDYPMDLGVSLMTSTKEDTMLFLKEFVGDRLSSLIQKNKHFDEVIEKAREIAIDRLGNMPEIEYVDTDWMFEDISDVLN